MCPSMSRVGQVPRGRVLRRLIFSIVSTAISCSRVRKPPGHGQPSRLDSPENFDDDDSLEGELPD